MNKVHFMSKSVEWNTPIDFFQEYNSIYCFDLDPCTNGFNSLAKNYLVDGLFGNWYGNVWLNPPYSRKLGLWIKKAFEECYIYKHCDCVVMLLPARTDTKWFHDYILPYGKISFIRGRLKFGGSKNNAPFPSMVVIFERSVGNVTF